MPIVDWQDDRSKEAAAAIEYGEDMTMYVLKLPETKIKNRWQGKLLFTTTPGHRRPRNQYSDKTVVVEIRKTFGGSSVRIRIFDTPSREGNKRVHLSMNGVTMFSEEDLAEMNMAIAEGIQVYLHPAHWIELNSEKK